MTTNPQSNPSGGGYRENPFLIEQREPKAAGLMARLFGVPLVIVGIVVGAAIAVVLLFGSLSSESQRPIPELLETLKQGGGGRTLGVLLPRDKELWQVANELAQRLRNKDQELTPEELDKVVSDLTGLLEREAAWSREYALATRGEASAPPDSGEREARDLHEKKTAYLMSALGLTGDARAVETLVKLMDADSANLRRDAIRALAELHAVPAARETLPRVTAALDDPAPVVRTVAAVALSSLAKPADAAVLERLEKSCLDEEREVRWNAALSLARLGGSASKGVLTDMLDREYWQKTVKLRVGDNADYPMPPNKIDEYLNIAIDAAACLADAGLWEQIRELQKDPSATVSRHAQAVVESNVRRKVADILRTPISSNSSGARRRR